MSERNYRAVYQELTTYLHTAPLYENQLTYVPTGEKKWIVRKGQPWPIRSLTDGLYPYVVLPDAEVRLAAIPRPHGIIHHPELCNGGQVIGAGMMRIVSTKMTYISNESGHYGPESDSITYSLAAFRFWGAPISPDINIDSRWDLFRS